MYGTVVRTALGASSTALPLQGTQYEFPNEDSVIYAATQTDATGVLQTWQSGSEVILEEAPLQIGTINQQPKFPDDFYVRFVVLARDRVKLALRDTSGAARVVLTNLMILSPEEAAALG